jgi:hypothetical protein
MNHLVLAGERIETYEVYNNQDEIREADQVEGIVDINLLKVPKKIKFTESENCQFDDSPSCNTIEVIEEEKVIQIKVQYQNSSWSNTDDDVTKYLEFNFPINSVSHEHLLLISENSRGWDFSGKKARARLRLANKLFKIQSEIIPKIISTIDYVKSQLCDPEDIFCEEIVVFKKIQIKVQQIKAELKSQVN